MSEEEVTGELGGEKERKRKRTPAKQGVYNLLNICWQLREYYRDSVLEYLYYQWVICIFSFPARCECQRESKHSE